MAQRSRASAWRSTGTIRPWRVWVAMPMCTAPWRVTTPASSSKRALICGKLGHRQHHGAHQQRQQRELPALLAPLRVQRRAQRLELGDVDFLDVAEVRDAALGLLHLLRDAPAQADDANGFLVRALDAAAAAHRGGVPRAEPCMRQVGVQVGLHDAAGGAAGAPPRCRSMPSSQARRRTAGEAIGRCRPAGGRAAAGAARRGCRRPVPRRGGRCAALRPRRGAAGARPQRGAGAAPAPPSAAPVSMRISSAPTASICPTSPPSASTRPATGDGISTVALSVITSASAWSSATVSPALTCQATSSTSAMPSPRSGILMTWVWPSQASIARRSAAATRAGPGKVGPFLRMRVGRVPAGHALDRRLQVVEAMLLHQRRQLGAEAAGARGLVHDDAAAGLLHRRDDGRQVQRPEAAQVDDLGVDAGLRGRRLATRRPWCRRSGPSGRRRRGTPRRVSSGTV